jgi:hypothetical protein
MPRRTWSVHAVLAAGLVVLGLAAGAGCSQKKGLSVTGIEPTSGPYTGNTTVTIHGSGFQQDGAKGVKVYFGGQQARVLGFVGDTMLKVDSPAGEVGQSVDVMLVFDDARNSEPLKFTYTEAGDQFNVDALVEGDKQQKAGGAAPPAPPAPPK